MDGYGYPYPSYPVLQGAEGEYPDHGDGFGDYFEMGQMPSDARRQSCSKYRSRQDRHLKRSRDSLTKTRSRSQSKTRSKSRSRSRSKSRSRSATRSRSGSRGRSRSRSRSRSGSRRRSHTTSRQRDLNLKEPSFLDAFRVMYLTPSKHKKSTTKYLSTKKHQDRIQELLKSDGLGSKRWLFYPRSSMINRSEPVTGEVPGVRDNVDQRVKVDGEFLRKYKRSKKIDMDAPIAKLKRWELILYKKVGFIQAV